MNKLTVSVVGGGAGGRLSLGAAAHSEHYQLVGGTEFLEKGINFIRGKKCRARIGQKTSKD